MHYQKSISKIMTMLKPGGLFVFTCASTGRPEHGTRRTSAYASWTTKIGDQEWSDYYKNLTKDDFYAISGFKETFVWHEFYYNPKSSDLYFVGVKTNPYKFETHTYPSKFDWKRYLVLNPDVARVNSSQEFAISHWLNHGSKEGRKH